VRKIAWELRPSILDALGLPDAIEWLAQDFRQRMGIRCVATVPRELKGLKPELATDIFRSCQELLTNVMRHANATRVEIKLEIGEDLRMEVADNGEGMAKAVMKQDSLGLVGLRERALRWGGRLETGVAQDGTGTRVVLSLPRASAFQNEG
jgi:signal transduction histidine kinase